MSKKVTETKSSARTASISKKTYKDSLRKLQIELVKLQRHFIKCDDKILIILEGRDASGKDGAIKRIVQHLSPRETRVVALGKPSDRDRTSWYFQRYAPYLPAAQELVLFNRSWYNRAGVERVMGFCTEAEHEEFMGSVSNFEKMLVGSGVKLLKYYLDISKAEQKRRLLDRKTDPLKQWKVSSIDDQALKNWKPYSLARNEMLARTHSPAALRYDETLLEIADIKVLVHQRAQKSEGESPSEDVSEHKPAHKHAGEPTPEGASASASSPEPAVPEAATVESPAMAASTAPASEGQAGKPNSGAPPSPAAAKPSA